jgi:hypothetical protein
MHASSVAQTGLVEVEDVVAGWKLVTELLRPIGLAICEHIDANVAGFTYIVYQPRGHRAGNGKFLYAGGSMRHPLSEAGGRYFGSAADAGCGTANAAGAVRFVISTTGDDIEQLNAAERTLLAGLNVAEDPRFWNQHNGAGAGWGREMNARARPRRLAASTGSRATADRTRS